ncbi:extracellular catalytic domain type 1 short-chain-length polyhydroxyalkanoate depolymerase [Sphaerisporangium corydalis]|uniref:PHB depolymerase family esterase n=1 Tax=Sphaerisporangium corydalis TaxID=1441875 RepID=A0ABV9ET67_9ACTN|nr:PHB depolymerase family esterase [Sphaerisporangium corydalis]
MKHKLRAVVSGIALSLVAAGTLLATSPSSAASLTRVTNFGTNPTNLNMYQYVPDTVAARPALLVLVHYCGGSASAIFSGNGHDYVTAADRYGYIIVLPEATRSEKCFDVSTAAGLRRDGGSDTTGIMSMVAYTRQRYNVDPGRIVVSGFSSGAMMTNVLAAQYPDVFAAGSAFSGVPAGCFSTTNGSLWNSQCSGGNLTKTAQQWGDQARAMYSGYTGGYPRMQLWHGTTDTTLAYPNFGEEIKQWTNLHGLSQTPTFTDRPQSSWTRTRYGGSGAQAPVEGISISGVGHSLPMSGQIAYAISFLGLDGSSVPPSPTPTPTVTPTVTPTPSASFRLRNEGAGRCVDSPNSASANGTLLQIYDCHTNPNQQFTYTTGKQLQTLGKCLDAPTNAGSGTRIQLWDCHGNTNQQWTLTSTGTVTNVANNLCLNVTGTGNTSSVTVATCNGQATQRWTQA